MPREESAGAVIFRKEDSVVKYLLLHYHFKSVFWGFPKGKIESGESPKDAAKREIKEETGVDVVGFSDGFEKVISYFFRENEKNIYKEVIYFLTETDKELIDISSEHIGYMWASYDNAMKKLKFQNAKDVLTAANDFLTKSLS